MFKDGVATRAGLICLVVCMFVALSASPLLADDKEQADKASKFKLDDKLAKQLEELADADPKVRQNATRELMRNSKIGKQELTALYQNATIEEQRQRILRVARHHTIRRLARQVAGDGEFKGSVGVSHRGVSSDEFQALLPDIPEADKYQGGVYIRDTLAGFPGHVELEADDVIVAINGQPLTPNISMMGFGEMIEENKAGDVITFTVLRGEEFVEVSLILAPQKAMREIYAQSTTRPNDSIEGFWRIWKDAIINPD